MKTSIRKDPSVSSLAGRLPENLFRRGVLLVFTFLASCAASAQATYTAERRLNVQIGATISMAGPGLPADASVLYKRIVGGGVYATVDPHPRFGAEAVTRRMAGSGISEQSYLVGPRYYRPFRRYTVYAKVLAGGGRFTFPDDIGSVSVPVVAPGGGVAYRISPSLQIRVDYEHQSWLGFGRKVTNFPGSLTPQVISFGVAYVVH